MPDIFGRAPLGFGGAFAADSAALFFAGLNAGGGGTILGAAGTLAQNMQVTYQQPIIRLYELGALLEYFVVGRPQGNGVINRVIGPRLMLYAFYHAFGDACNAINNNLFISANTACTSAFSANPQGGDEMSFGLRHCVLTTYGLSVAAQDMVFNESLPFMFISLETPTDADFIVT